MKIIENNYQDQLIRIDGAAYYNNLKMFLLDYDYHLVASNLKEHILKSSYLPKIADLVKRDEEKDFLEKSAIESKIYISMLEEEEKNIRPKSDEELQRIKEIKEKMKKLQRDGRKRYDERIARLFEQ